MNEYILGLRPARKGRVENSSSLIGGDLPGIMAGVEDDHDDFFVEPSRALKKRF
jgi:hypothetical protein